jgi:hypothetical protein
MGDATILGYKEKGDVDICRTFYQISQLDPV